MSDERRHDLKMCVLFIIAIGMGLTATVAFPLNLMQVTICAVALYFKLKKLLGDTPPR